MVCRLLVLHRNGVALYSFGADLSLIKELLSEC